MTKYIYEDNFDLFVQHISITEINIPDRVTEKTAFEVAIEEDRARFFDYMIKKVVDLKDHRLSKTKGEIKDSLIRRSKFLNTEYNAGYSRLHVAVIDGEPEVIRYIINRGLCDRNNSDVPIGTPIQLAILLCHIECIKALIEFSVDVDIVNKHNQTALQMAVEHDIICSVPELFILSKDINTGRYMEFTYLQLAVICNWRDLLPILFSTGADVHLETIMPDDKSMACAVEMFSNRPTLIPLTSLETCLSLCLKLYGELHSRLLDFVSGDMINLTDGHGNSLLHLAASVQNVELCEELLLRGANVNFYNNAGKNALQEMFKWRSFFSHKIKRPVAVGTLLINAGIDVNMDDWSNNNIIKEALTINNEKFFNLVLQNTAVVDYSIVSFNATIKRRWFTTANLLLSTMPDSLKEMFVTGELALTYFNQAKKEDTEVYLLHFSDTKINLLLDILADRNDIKLFKTFLETKNIKPSLLDNGETLLTKLILNNKKEFIDAIVKSNQCGVFISLPNKSGLKPLHLAIKMRNKELIEFIVLEEVSFNSLDGEGNTVLGLLFKTFTDEDDLGFVERTAKMMINGGAQLNAVDVNKVTAIEYCLDPGLRDRLVCLASRKNALSTSVKIETECKVCLTNPVECALECGHVYCSPCVVRCTNCPTCRKPSRSIRKLYF